MVGSQISDAIVQHKKALKAAAAAAEDTSATAATTATTDGAEGAKEKGSSTAVVADELKFAAVVDPPRSGVHTKCLRSIRATKAIKRLVRVCVTWSHVCVFQSRWHGAPRLPTFYPCLQQGTTAVLLHAASRHLGSCSYGVPNRWTTFESSGRNNLQQ